LLSAGDAISFDAGIPHRLFNAGTEKAAFISAVSPPTF
ncbi:MAG TPA: cupin domain-containing protein, partial [Firmicutes bacterium]|nr:cupin domain-containing protein [Bacillota bacterium]